MELTADWLSAPNIAKSIYINSVRLSIIVYYYHCVVRHWLRENSHKWELVQNKYDPPIQRYDSGYKFTAAFLWPPVFIKWICMFANEDWAARTQTFYQIPRCKDALWDRSVAFFAFVFWQRARQKRSTMLIYYRECAAANIYVHNVHAQTRWRIYIESSQVGFIVACVHDISWADIDFALFGSGILDRVYCVCSWGEGESRRARCRSRALCIGINIMAHRKQLALGAQSPHL